MVFIFDMRFTIYKVPPGKHVAGAGGLHPSPRLSPRAAGREGAEPWVVWIVLSLAESNMEFGKRPTKRTNLNQIKPG